MCGDNGARAQYVGQTLRAEGGNKRAALYLCLQWQDKARASLLNYGIIRICLSCGVRIRS